jgi:hypothetical protein
MSVFLIFVYFSLSLCHVCLISVVAGIRTPLPIASLSDTLPEVYQELLQNVQLLEKNFQDMQVGYDRSLK